MPTTTPIQKAGSAQPPLAIVPWFPGLAGKGYVALKRGRSRTTASVVIWACDAQGLPQAAEVMQMHNMLGRPGREWAILRVAPDGSAKLSDPRGTLGADMLRRMKAAVEALGDMRVE